MITHKTIAQWLSIVVLLIGLIVAISWYTHFIFFIQLSPHLITMQFNAALCFIAAGSGLLAKLNKKKAIALWCGIFIGLISGLTVIQYLFKVNLGIDDFFFTPTPYFDHLPRGRMSFITAFGLFIIALLLLQKDLKTKKNNYLYNQLFTFIILITGTVPLIGYLSGVNTTYYLEQLTPMSFHSAIAFIMFSLALYASQWGHNFKKTEHRIIWFSTLATLILFSFTVAVWQQNLNIEHTWAMTMYSKTQAIYLSKNTPLNALGLIAGSILSFLIGITLYNAQMSSYRNIKLTEKTTTLSVMERRQQQIVDQVEDYAIFWINLQGYIETWSHGAQKMLGYRLHEILGKPYSLFFIEEERSNDLPRQILNTAREKNNFEKNMWLQKKDETHLWTHLVIEMVKNEMGKANGFAVFIQNKDPLRQLELENSRLLNSINESSDFIGMLNTDGRLLYCNHKAKEMLGYPSNEELPSITIADMYPYRLIQHMQEEILPTVLKKGFWSGDSILIDHLTGHEIPVLQTITLYKDKQQNAYYLTTVMRDITERKKMEEALKISEELFRATMEYAAIGMALVSVEGRFTKVNKALCQIVGFTEIELLNISFQEITYPDDLQTDLDNVNKLLSGEIESYQMEKRYIRKDKAVVWILLSASLVRNSQNNPIFFIAQIQNIDNQKKREQKLKYRAYHDALTDLANREYLESVFEYTLKAARRHHSLVALMFLDLDYFKEINDTYGHYFGDLLLIEIASRLKSCARADDILVRFGGDEFIIVSSDLSCVEDSFNIAKKILTGLTKPLIINQIDIKISISMGISIYPFDGDNLDTLLKNADKALYQIKEEGRNAFKRYEG